MHCHIFLVKEKAIEIPRAIGRAFKIMEETGTVPAPMSATATAAPPGEVADSTSTLKAFDAFYLGNEKVDSTVGNAVVAQAIERLEDSRHRQSGASKGTKRDTRGDAVTIVVNEHSIRTVERLSGETIMHEYITNVSFTCVPSHDKNKDMFAYICQNESVGIINCHIFNVASDLGKMINDSVRSAVRITHEKLRKKGANPFGASPDSPREVPQGDLFRKQIHRADLKAVKVIGAGQYGEVWLAVQHARKHKDKGGGVVRIKRAVKMLKNNASRQDKQEFLREAETMLALGEHNNLLRLVGVAVQQAPWLAVLQFCDHGDLRAVVKACKDKQLQLRPEEQLWFCEQLASGCAHMASKRLVHMDLAARNCLLASGNNVKVADFGLTRPLDRGTNHIVLKERLKLPIKWISLEGLDDKVFSEASDVWAFGVLMWEVVSYGETP